MTQPRRNALNILSCTANDFTPHDDSIIHTSFLDIMDVIAIEHLEGLAVTLGRAVHRGKTLRLVATLEGPPEHAWIAWLEDCAESSQAPQIHWRVGDEGQRGPTHAAISARIAIALKEVRDDAFRSGLRVEIRADISGVSAHQKLAMTGTRKNLLESI